MGECISIMVQALRTEDGSLPQGLTVQNTYTELRQGSKKAVMVVRNNTAYLQTLQKKTPVARAVAALPVPEPLEEEQLPEGADESHDPHAPRLTGKDMVNCLMNWTWMALVPGLWAGRCCLLAPGQIPWHVLIGSSWVGLYPLHRTYDKSYRWHFL